jgi:RNA polymerase sigma factor (sigma-70 family)
MRTEDGDIIQKCLSGDTTAFGLLVDKYKASVYALAYAKLSNFHDAQDITQEVFLKAYQKLRTLKRWDKFLSWLYAITSNLCKDFLRAKARRLDGEYIADQNTAHLERLSLASHHENEVYQSLHETLAMLPEIHRQVLTLHYLGGLSCLEIGQFLGASPDTIAKRLSRARSKLKKEMLTLMNTHFAQQKLQPAFTFNIIEAVKRTRIQPNPQTPAIPVGFAALGILALTLLCLTVPLDQFPAIGNMVGAPVPSETEVMEVGEIPVDAVVLAETAIVSSGDGKKDLARNPQPTDIVLAANAETEVETAIKPTTRLGKGRVHRIAYSPDGKLIAVMGALGIWLYDAETLTEVGMIAEGAGAIAFSPDGQTLASGSWSDTVHLWEVSTQKRVGRLMSPRQRSVTTLAFTPDGNTLAVGYGKGNIVLWDMKTQQQTALLDTPSSVLSTLVFSPDGKLLASGGFEDLTVSLWNVQTQTLVGAFEGHTNDMGVRPPGILSVAFSPDGKTLASGSNSDETVRLWEVATREQIALLPKNDEDEEYELANSVAFSPDGTILAETGEDAKIRLWDVQTQRQICVLNTKAGGVSSIAFRPDGQTLASLNGGFDGRHKGGDMAVRLWNVKTRKQIAVSQNHTAAINSVALSPDDALLASGHDDGVVRLWDMQTQKQIATLTGHKAAVRSVAFSPDGTLLASGERDSARLWDVQKRKRVAVFKKNNTIVESVAFSPDGRILASVDDSCIRLWDTRRNRAIGVLGPEPLHESPIRFNSIIRSVAFSPDGTLLASGGIDNTLRLWDVQKRQEIFMHKLAQQGNIMAVAFSPDGKTLAVAGTHKKIYLWSAPEQELITTLNTSTIVWKWSVPEQELIETLKTPAIVWTLAFSPDGRFLAAGTGAEIRVWDIKTQTEVTTLRCMYLVTSIAFSHDGKKVVAGSLDGTIRVWDTDKFGGN